MTVSARQRGRDALGGWQRVVRAGLVRTLFAFDTLQPASEASGRRHRPGGLRLALHPHAAAALLLPLLRPPPMPQAVRANAIQPRTHRSGILQLTF